MRTQTIRYQAADSSWSGELPALDSEHTLVLMFGARRFQQDPAVIAELRRHYPRAILAGCSTSGEVKGDTITDDSMVVAVSQFEHTTLKKATATIADAQGSRDVGRALAEQLAADDLRGVILLSDGLSVNGTDLAAGMSERLGDEVIVTGGLAGDGAAFERTWVLDEHDAPTTGCVAAIGLYGDRVRIGHGSRGGWDAFGPERTITNATSNVLFELDGQPALDLYKEYLGSRADGLPSTGLLFPLAIRAQEGDDKRLVRTILAVDEETRSMTFAGDVPEGWRAQLMKANFDRLIDGAAEAAQQTRREDENALSTLAIAISCVGRRLVLGERAEEEIEAVLDSLPGASELVGFYSYGEISPSTDGSCDLHNQT
ncbi:MAG: FIST C-terminal domain-containing protein, partial [Planctomycetes bacterium]|nr:FIST C-terminal domain-containing protein [Planctomycetota bacterium]